ncbi:hypothetical protein [Stutzerimonas kirkiae]|uniref:hypothetical protein n=1 Tax=Stutzerimonas kirkiae TaxID=2211392 RepID=UPI001037C04A|nr:hypothetical protein [Stutzerimonas kirkiae]
MSIRITTLTLLVDSSPFAWARAPLALPSSISAAHIEAAPPSSVTPDQPIGTDSRIGLIARETPAPVKLPRAVMEVHNARDSREALNGMSGINTSAMGASAPTEASRPFSSAPGGPSVAASAWSTNRRPRWDGWIWLGSLDGLLICLSGSPLGRRHQHKARPILLSNSGGNTP